MNSNIYTNQFFFVSKYVVKKTIIITLQFFRFFTTHRFINVVILIPSSRLICSRIYCRITLSHLLFCFKTFICFLRLLLNMQPRKMVLAVRHANFSALNVIMMANISQKNKSVSIYHNNIVILLLKTNLNWKDHIVRVKQLTTQVQS